MIRISINGKVLDREFQNMAQALAFAYQNGECYGAEKVELAIAKETVKKHEEVNTTTKVKQGLDNKATDATTVTENKEAGVENADQT